MARHDPDRLLTANPFRHFRRTYSLTEVRMGVVVLAVLVAITVWITWRGKQRPPEIYGAVELSGEKQAVSTASTAAGAVPVGLLGEAWIETERSEFEPSNLYEKINGRADFFTSKGFERLHFVSFTSKEKGTLSVDLELYDMGSPAGALSAFTAERKDGVDSIETPSSQYYLSRNAMFLVRGKFYARALGADESEPVLAALALARETLDGALTGGERSWALELFVDGLGFDPGKVTFVGERAFSLEVAKAMWIVALEGDAEMFISARKTAEAAAADAVAIVAGFASYGTPSDGAGEGEPVFVTDEFLGAVSSAVAEQNFVIGVRAAADVEAARAALTRLREAVAGMSPALRERALAAAIDSGAGSASDEAPDDEAADDKTAEPTAPEGSEPGLDDEETY